MWHWQCSHWLPCTMIQVYCFCPWWVLCANKCSCCFACMAPPAILAATIGWFFNSTFDAWHTMCTAATSQLMFPNINATKATTIILACCHCILWQHCPLPQDAIAMLPGVPRMAWLMLFLCTGTNAMALGKFFKDVQHGKAHCCHMLT